MRIFLQRKYTARENGSMTFFVAFVVLPVMFLLFSLSLDLATYFRETQRAQKILDDAAMYGYRFLPFTSQAESAIRAYLAEDKQLSDKVELNVTPDFISLSVNFPAHISFAKLIGADVQVPVTAITRVRGTPFDTFIAIDSSAYLGPAVLGGTAWGDALEWPAAQFFSVLNPLKDNLVPVDPRNLTQQCFNPAFSQLKVSAISAYEYLAGFSLNAVGVGFYPSNVTFMDLAREVTPSGSRDGTNGEADLPLYRSPFSQSEYCAATAAYETNHLGYRFPTSNSTITGLWSPPQGKPDMITNGSYEFNPEYQSYLQTSEVIWSRALQQGAMPNIDEVLIELRARLIAAKPVAADHRHRGGLVNKMVKVGIIFAGDVPRLARFGLAFEEPQVTDSMQRQFDLMKCDVVGRGVDSGIAADPSLCRDVPANDDSKDNIPLRIFYVLFQHQGNNATVPSKVGLLRDYFQNAGKDNNGNDLFHVRLLYGKDPSSLTQDLLGNLVADSKTAVLSR